MVDAIAISCVRNLTAETVRDTILESVRMVRSVGYSERLVPANRPTLGWGADFESWKFTVMVIREKLAAAGMELGDKLADTQLRTFVSSTLNASLGDSINRLAAMAHDTDLASAGGPALKLCLAAAQ